MEKDGYFEEKRRQPRYSIKLPLEYSQTDDSYRGGMTVNLSESGSLMRSIQNLPIHAEVNVRVFFPNEYEFDGIRMIARVVWKEHHCETDWKGYLYGLEFIRVSDEDHCKLIALLNSASVLEEMSTKENGPFPDPQPERIKVPDLHLHSRIDTRRTSMWERLMKNTFHLR